MAAKTGSKFPSGEPHGCPCGFFGDLKRPCTCSAPQIRRYLAKISDPLLDRIDIHPPRAPEVPRLSTQELMGKQLGETSATVRRRVCKARDRQVHRLKAFKLTCNAQLRSKSLREACELIKNLSPEPASDLLKAAINQFSLSARAYDRILTVSRTIADMEEADNIQMHHVAEAINYRTLDRKLFA